MSLRKRINSFRYAFAGLSELFRSQANARIQLAAALLALGGGWYYRISPVEWALITLCIAMVLALEAANTAVEYLTDLVSPDRHPLAGKIKDLTAAAVLIAAIGSVVVALIIFMPRIFYGIPY